MDATGAAILILAPSPRGVAPDRGINRGNLT